MKAQCEGCQAVAEELTPTAAPSLLCFELSQTRAPRAGLLLPGTDTAPGDSSPAGIAGLKKHSQHRAGGVPAVRMGSDPARDIKTKATAMMGVSFCQVTLTGELWKHLCSGCRGVNWGLIGFLDVLACFSLESIHPQPVKGVQK